MLVSPVSPWAASFGAQQRTALLYEALAGLMPVDVLLVSEGGADRVEAGDRPEILASLSWKQPSLALWKYGVHAWVDGWCRSNLDWAKYSVIVGRYVTPASKIAWPSHVRTIVDCDDAMYRCVPRWAGPVGRAAAAAEGWLRYRQTRAAIARYDHVFFCSRRDRDLFSVRSSSVLPNAVQLPRVPAEDPDGSAGNALIVGSMWYPPNRQGVEWFLERCWPEIAARCPALNLRIVGAAPSRDRQRWARAVRTEAPGFVEDLDAEYSRALFAIAPVHYGGGACVKFLEAAAHRRACIATGYVAAAFDSNFREGFSTLVACDARSMVGACVTLCADIRRRRAIAANANQTVTRLYSARRFTDVVREALRRFVAG